MEAVIAFINYYENIPEFLILTTLSNAGIWKSGSTPDRNNPKFYNGTIPWIKTGELNNSIIVSSQEKITSLAIEKCSLPVNDIGNVLIAMYGATIGKLGIAGIELTSNQACCGCKPYSGVYNKYLFYYLMASKQKLLDLAEGGAQPNISREKIIKFPFILGSYKYQIKKMVKILPS